MNVEAFNQNIKLQILKQAKEHIKQNIEPEIKKLNCKQCNLQEYSIVDFSDEEKSIIAHLKCANCGFGGDFMIHLKEDGLDDGLDSVNKGLHDLQNTIEDINRQGLITIKI